MDDEPSVAEVDRALRYATTRPMIVRNHAWIDTLLDQRLVAMSRAVMEAHLSELHRG